MHVYVVLYEVYEVFTTVSIICRLRTADRTENKMHTERYKMQTGDKMQTGCE